MEAAQKQAYDWMIHPIGIGRAAEKKRSRIP